MGFKVRWHPKSQGHALYPNLAWGRCKQKSSYWDCFPQSRVRFGFPCIFLEYKWGDTGTGSGLGIVGVVHLLLGNSAVKLKLNWWTQMWIWCHWVLNTLVSDSVLNTKSSTPSDITFSKTTISHFSTTFKTAKKGLAHGVTATHCFWKVKIAVVRSNNSEVCVPIN